VLKFDKIKLISSINNINVINENAFEKIVKNDVITSLKFNRITPYLLYIEIDFIENELVIEFTGKILGSDYKKLISAATIRQCFENINSLGVCSLDVEAILADAIVVKCDVTQDVYCADIPSVTNYIRSNISNYQSYAAKLLRNGNFVVDKNVTTRQAKKRLTIYDKGKEMNKMENRRFLEKYDVSAEDFRDVCRFEMNLNSIAQIKSSLGITDTRLMSVLTSTKNPILDFLDDVVADTDSVIPLSNKQSYITALVLQDCNNDLAVVEEKMRQLYSKGTNLSKVMKPYRDALAKKNESKFTKTDLLQMLR
jgi:hypothetical protein